MAIVLCRIDDRLIHGQVVIGWGRPLGVDLIWLVDDAVAGSEWEQDLYRMAVPPEIEVHFVTVAVAASQLGEWSDSDRRGMLLTGDVGTMAALHTASPVAVHRINLGGIHHRPGRRERLPYVYLSDDEIGVLLELEKAGADVSARDLPTTPPVALKALT